MSHKATLRLAFADEAEARRLLAAIEPENGKFLRARVEDHFLVAEAEADSPLALLHTLDDVLACLSAAQKAGNVASEP